MENNIIEAPVRKINEIVRGEKTYIFDPGAMTIGQWEAAEKELIEARFYELMSKHADYVAQPANRSTRKYNIKKIVAGDELTALLAKQTELGAKVKDKTMTPQEFEAENQSILKEIYENPKDAEDFGALFMPYSDTDTSEAAKTARDYWERRGRREKSYTKTLQELHYNLLKSGGRIKMLCALIVPKGSLYSTTTNTTIERDLIPSLTQQEAEAVLGNFLSLPALADHISLNYMRME